MTPAALDRFRVAVPVGYPGFARFYNLYSRNRLLVTWEENGSLINTDMPARLADFGITPIHAPTTVHPAPVLAPVTISSHAPITTPGSSTSGLSIVEQFLDADLAGHNALFRSLLVGSAKSKVRYDERAEKEARERARKRAARAPPPPAALVPTTSKPKNKKKRKQSFPASNSNRIDDTTFPALDDDDALMANLSTPPASVAGFSPQAGSSQTPAV